MTRNRAVQLDPLLHLLHWLHSALDCTYCTGSTRLLLHILHWQHSAIAARTALATHSSRLSTVLLLTALAALGTRLHWLAAALGYCCTYCTGYTHPSPLNSQLHTSARQNHSRYKLQQSAGGRSLAAPRPTTSLAAARCALGTVAVLHDTLTFRRGYLNFTGCGTPARPGWHVAPHSPHRIELARARIH